METYLAIESDVSQLNPNPKVLNNDNIPGEQKYITK